MSLPPWIEPAPFGPGDEFRVNPLDEFRFEDEAQRQYFDDVEFPERNEMRGEREDDWIIQMEMEMERARRKVPAKVPVEVPIRFKLFKTNLRLNHWF